MTTFEIVGKKVSKDFPSMISRLGKAPPEMAHYWIAYFFMRLIAFTIWHRKGYADKEELVATVVSLTNAIMQECGDELFIPEDKM